VPELSLLYGRVVHHLKIIHGTSDAKRVYTFYLMACDHILILVKSDTEDRPKSRVQFECWGCLSEDNVVIFYR
jgi:hypothetical protein